MIGTELTVGNLCENKEYDFRVAAVNDAGPGEYALTPCSIKLLSTSGKFEVMQLSIAIIYYADSGADHLQPQ